MEVDLCGHATLASAHFLWEVGPPAPDPGGAISDPERIAERGTDGDWIVLDFPRTTPTEAAPPDGLVEALGCKPAWTGRSRFDFLVVLDSAETVRKLTPDLVGLANTDARGVIVTAEGDTRGVDFVSRFFAPRVGVPEDPVTGSAHCALAPYWAERLGRTILTGYQASARGGTVRVETKGERVLLGGKARTVVRGELLEP